MDKRAKYLLALAQFGQRVIDLCGAANALRVAAQDLDPEGTAPDDPVAVGIFAQAEAALLGACATMPGLRQLLLRVTGQHMMEGA